MAGLSRRERREEEEEVFFEGRVSKAEVVAMGEGEPTGSGETSRAFRLSPKAGLVEEATSTGLELARTVFEVPFEGVPIFGKVHFFLVRTQA